MSTLAPTEIKALARIIGEIDYYELLHLRRDAARLERVLGARIEE